MARSIWVVVSGAERARCKWCRDQILWVTSASRPGARAKALAFNVPAPQALERRRNDETRVVFESWPLAALHAITCRARPRKGRTAA